MWFGPGCKNKTLSLSGFGSICPIFSFSSRAPPSSLSSLRQQQVLSRSYWLRQLPLHSLFWQPLFTHSPHPTPSLFALYNNKPTERPAAVVLFSTLLLLLLLLLFVSYKNNNNNNLDEAFSRFTGLLSPLLSTSIARRRVCVLLYSTLSYISSTLEPPTNTAPPPPTPPPQPPLLHWWLN